MGLVQKIRYYRNADGSLALDDNNEPKPHLNEDGSIHYINEWTPLPGEETIAVIQTGPASGPVVLEDGTTYDVTPDHIQVSEKHASAVTFHILKQLERDGTLTRLVHGDKWDGTPATVDGDETAHTFVPGVASAPEG